MKLRRTIAFTFFVSIAVPVPAETVSFGSGDNRFEMEFVTIGNPGNPPDELDSRGDEWGAVDYVYQIAKFETNCKAVDSLRPGGFQHCGDRPIRGGHGDAARFVNDLNIDSGFLPAYKFTSFGRSLDWLPSDAGYDPDNPVRNSLARYVLPTADEWHKAAYYDPSTETYFDFATSTNEMTFVDGNTTAEHTFVFGGFEADTVQAGGLSPYGTMGQTGNVGEWEEDEGHWRAGLFAAIWQQSAATSRLPNTGFNVGWRVAALSSGIPGDLNGDGTVSFADFLILSDHFGNPGRLAQGDINGNGFVDFPDFLILANNFNSEPVMAPSVPEPSTLDLFLIGGLAALGRLRRRT